MFFYVKFIYFISFSKIILVKQFKFIFSGFNLFIDMLRRLRCSLPPQNSSPFFLLGRNYSHPPKWEVVIGIEVHAQLKTKHKLLSHTQIDQSDLITEEVYKPEEDSFFEFKSVQQPHGTAPPNTLVGLCEGGLPGALPSWFLI